MNSSENRHAKRLTVSVVLASHNGARFIGEQLASILGQTRLPDEIVVSDDASTDDTVDIVEKQFRLAARRSRPQFVRLKVIRNPVALGVAANFEAACAASSGDVLALCDQDDVWEPERLQEMVALFDADPELILLHSDAALIDDAGRKIGQSLLATIRFSARERRAIAEGNAFDVLLRRNVVTGATAIFRRDLLGISRPFPSGWVHDEWLALVAALVGRVRLLDRPLTRYRQHDSNQIGATELTLAAGIERFTTSRAERNVRLLEHARTLVTKIDDLGDRVTEAKRLKADAKLRHEEFRSSLPVARLARLVPVVSALIRGRYRAYSRGTIDAVRDILQVA